MLVLYAFVAKLNGISILIRAFRGPIDADLSIYGVYACTCPGINTLHPHLAFFSSPLHTLGLKMTLSPISDPDPTTQIPWPGARKRSDRDVDQGTPQPNGSSRYSSRRPSVVSRSELNGKRRLSTLNLFNLSISMAGAQVAWTVELG